MLFLAVALSMDAFAVSIGLGAKKTKSLIWLAFLSGVFFGFFQAGMPLVGHLIGTGLVQYVASVDHWIAFILLTFIGSKMIYESFSIEDLQDSSDRHFPSLRTFILLAIATSIDALAAGLTLSLFPINPYLSIALIGVITFIFSFVGVYIGERMGTFLESKAEFIGGVVLIFIGAKILVQHLHLFDKFTL